MPAPEKILELVERFDLYKENYLSGSYKEAQLRKEFIDPFFKELGWDMDNERGYAEAYKDVIHEDSIKIGNNPEAPDYCFRIGGTRKFFLEAKKPSTDIRRDIHPAYQLRRYAWSSKLPLSILTNFEEFAVYDCRIKPSNTDDAHNARIEHMAYTRYPEKWDKIASIFSREAVLKGSFDKYAETSRGKKGTSEVDVAFLKEIESWRDVLARTIALRNPLLSRRDLNFCVQRTIDRIIFLRICEDRSIEEYQSLMALLNGNNIYRRLCEMFYRADARYNSGLFHFSHEKNEAEPPDELTLSLSIDDKPLKDIIRCLYYPESPYEFSVLPADILGQVYEQFLGKVIRLTEGHRAVVEDKPEVKKAGGVYYTPTYIVDYIVKNTVGKLLEDKTPDSASSLRILDPACGSGSFLIGAYQYLLDWHLKWYIDHTPEKWTTGRKPRLVQVSAKDFRLTIDERKRILLNSIYGVDIDPQAVEVTKLSLLLKVLEGESSQTLESQLKLFHERALPDLAGNIKCGNSLIGPDFYDGAQIGLFDDEERYRINVFDWKREFKDIFDSGGFDAVVGNPPWVSISGKFGVGIYPPTEIKYLIQKYAGNTYMPNMYEYFVAKGLNILNINGYFGYIVPDRLGFNSQFVGLRKRMLKQTQIISLIYRVPFPGITADTLIFILRRSSSIDPKSLIEVGEYGCEPQKISQYDIEKNPTYSFHYFDNYDAMNLIKKLAHIPCLLPLGSLCESTSGFGGKSQLVTSTRINNEQIETAKGNSINRYVFKKKYWFNFRKENITGRTTDMEKLGTKFKILLRKTGDQLLATFDDSGIFPEQSLYFLYNNHSDMNFKYLLGILNSTFATFYYRNKLITNRRSIAQLKKVDLDAFPIRTIDFSSPADVAHHDRMVSLVDAMLALNRQLAAAQTAQDKTAIKRQIDATDNQIDRLV